MTVTLSPTGVVELAGICPVEDAEILLQHLLSAPHAAVDWCACEAAHSAVIQVLLVAKISPQGPPLGVFLKDHIWPLLGRTEV